MKNKFTLALTLAVIFSLIAATGAWADNLLTDGDGLAPVVDTASLNLGNVCRGSTTTKPILHAISRNGNYPGINVFAKGTTVTVSVGTVAGSGLSASGGGSISLPANWDTVANNTLSNSVSSSIVFSANSLGAFSGTVNYSASGTGSNSGSLIRTDSINVVANVINCDTTAPTLHLPANITAEATGASGAVVTYTATADDANPVHPLVTCAPASGSTFGFGATTVNCSATDAASNTATGNFTITVVDTTPPTVTPPSNISVEALDASGAVVTYSGESATDLVDGSLAASCAPVSGSTFPLGLNTVSCSATDSHSNTGTSSFTIDVKDTTAPVLSLPADISIEATGASGAAITFTASASDSVDGPVAVSCDASSGNTFPLGTTTVNCSASDSHGNLNSGSFKINVVDTTAPELTLPVDFSVEATGPSGAVATFTATALDIVDGSLAVTCDANSGNTFPLGATTVNCSAADAHNNSASGSFKITVVDTTPPNLTLSADQQLEATGSTGAAATFSPTPSATDLVDGTVAVTCNAVSGATFPLGTTTVHCSATDAANNTATGSFMIIVVDTTAPVIVAHADVAAEATSAAGATVSYTAPATSDIVDGAGSATCAPASGSQFALGNTTVTCNASDAAGNASIPTTFVVHVVDTTAPLIAAHADVTAEATSAAGATVSYTAPATSDAVDGAGTATCAPASGSQFALGNTTVNCTASDAAGNASTQTAFVVHVVDTTAPVIAAHADVTAEATSASGAPVSYTAPATSDAVDGAGTATCAPTSGSQFILGNTTVNCTASDAAGNASTPTSFIVHVVDTTAPVITVPANISTGPNSPLGANVTYGAATASDLVDGSVTPVACTPAPGSLFTFGTTTVTCSATDSHGNTGSNSFTVTVGNLTFLGFFQPVDNLPALNTVKNGSTVPVKWKLQGQSGVEITSTSAVVSTVATKVSCGDFSNQLEAPIETVTTGGTSLRYDFTAMQFIYNWQTPKQPNTCWRLNVKFTDGVIKSADFKLK